MLVNYDPDEEVNLPEAEYVCRGCRCTWDNVCALRPCGCEALRVRSRRAALCAGMSRWFTLLQAAWSSGPFSSKVHRSPWAAAILLHIYEVGQLPKEVGQLPKKLVNFLNGKN